MALSNDNNDSQDIKINRIKNFEPAFYQLSF